jgi:hypothetical protein
MAQFDTFFTGKGFSTPIPPADQRSQERLSDFIIKAAELKFNVYRENAKEFLKVAEITPEFVLSDSARKATSIQITEFTKKWGKIAAQRASTGGMTDEEKMQMATDKAWIISQNQNDVAAMTRWQQMRDVVMKDTTSWDDVEFAKWTADYIKTGQFNYVSPPVKSVDFSSYLQSESKGITSTYPAGTTDQGNQIINRTVNLQDQNAPTDEVSNFIRSRLFKNDQARQGLIEEFTNAPDRDQYLQDMNRDGQIDDKDIDNNAIIRWAVNNPKYRQASVIQKAVYKTKPGTSTETEKIPKSNVAGSPVALSPGVQTPDRQKIYGDKEYSKTQSFNFGGNVTLYGIRTKGGKAINANWTDEEIASGSINGRLVLYDPTKHIFLVESVTQSESADQKSRTLLEIPEENILNYENIPIIYTGKQMTIGEYKKFMEGESPKPQQVAPKENIKTEETDIGI